MRIYGIAAGLAAAAMTIGFGPGAASAQQSQLAPGIEAEVLGTVEAGDNCPGHVLRMRRITFAPGTSIPMHSHKTHPEVSLVTDGTLTNTLKGQPPQELTAGSPVLNGPEVEHLPANRSNKPVTVLSIDLIKQK
ncbi:MAG TPA: cupin domain-containing protein [Stellaceae bacterium]|jgi:quercetin dioxygenase-like cupin family protein